jgi:hypothetical protein
LYLPIDPGALATIADSLLLDAARNHHELYVTQQEERLVFGYWTDVTL